jgi:hypothetical protein
VDIRLTGTVSECAAAVETLRVISEALDVHQVSGLHRNHGPAEDSGPVRIYLEVRVRAS